MLNQWGKKKPTALTYVVWYEGRESSQKFQQAQTIFYFHRIGNTKSREHYSCNVIYALADLICIAIVWNLEFGLLRGIPR